MLQLKPESTRVVFHHTGYMGNCYERVSSYVYLACGNGSGKRNVSKVALHEFDVSVLLKQDSRSYRIFVA